MKKQKQGFLNQGISEETLNFRIFGLRTMIVIMHSMAIHLRLRQGQSFAIAGVTGSGKTSVVSVLTRLYEIDRGKILIDERNIQDIGNNI